jgi:hypothetical protein
MTVKLDSNPCCPKCETVLDGATDLDGKGVAPSPGDITMCIYCHTVMEFTDDMQFAEFDVTTLPQADQDIFTTMMRQYDKFKPTYH